MSDINNGAPVPPEGMSQAARQEAADAAYGRTHNADAAAASMNAGKAREAEAEAKKARKEAEAAEKAAMKAERQKARDEKKAAKQAKALNLDALHDCLGEMPACEVTLKNAGALSALGEYGDALLSVFCDEYTIPYVQ